MLFGKVKRNYWLQVSFLVCKINIYLKIFKMEPEKLTAEGIWAARSPFLMSIWQFFVHGIRFEVVFCANLSNKIF